MNFFNSKMKVLVICIVLVMCLSSQAGLLKDKDSKFYFSQVR